MPTTIARSRRFAIPFVITFAFLAVAGISTAVWAVCSPGTSYTVTSSAPPPIGNWTDTSGAVWSPAGGFPGCATGDSAADTNGTSTVLIINSAIPNPINGLNLACSGCTIDIQSGGSLTLAGSGSIGAATTIIVEPGGTFTIANGGNLTVANGASLSVNGGYADVQPGGTLTQNGSSTVTNGGTLNVNGTWHVNNLFTIQSSGHVTLGGATVDGTNTINNNGSLTQSGSDSAISSIFNNKSGATFTVNSGTLHLSGGGTGDAAFTMAGGAILDFPSGSYTMTANGTVSGAGTLQVSGGTLSIGGVTSPGGFTMTAGTLTGAGFLNTNTMLWSGGTITGTGGTQINGGGSGTFDASVSDLILDGRSFNDYGYISYTATANSLYLTNDASFAVYGTFDIQADGSIEDGGAGGTFTIAPNGFLVKSGGTGTSTIYPTSMNTATVLAASGTLDFAGDGTHSGAFFANSGATMAFSASSTTLNGFVAGDGTFSFPAGSTALDGTYSVTGLTSITGGNVQVGTTATTKDFTLTTGVLNLQNQFTMSGTGTWSGGSISGTDVFDVASGATLTIDCANGNTLLNGAQLTNDGTVNYTCPVAGGQNLSLTAGYIANNGTFDIRTDQPITQGIVIVGSSPRRGSKSSVLGSSFIDNNSGATFEKSAGSGTTNIAPDFTNAGTVLALSGVIDFATYTQTAGETTLGPGGITVDTTMQLSGGKLDGTGTLTGDLQNDATVAPATSSTIGTINLTGNYTQGSAGALTMKIGGTSSYDQLAVSGTATLDGTLNESLVNSFTPANGDVYPVLTFASRSGDFATKNLPTFAGTHGSFTATYTPTELDLNAVVSPSSANVGISLSGPLSVNAGAPLSIDINISNSGPDASTGTISSTFNAPTGATGISGNGTGWSCGASSGLSITCTTTTPLPASSSLPTLTISMTAPPDGGLANYSGSVTPTTPDPSNGNNGFGGLVNVVAQADLALAKTGPSGVTAGQNVVYTVTVTNNGPSSATNVVVSDPPPTNLTFLSNSGACTSAYPCNVGTLANGQMATITSTYSTSPSFAGNVTNTASVSATEPDPNGANNTDSKTTNVGAQADLSITKSGPTNANAGSNIVYTINFTNAGPSPATNVVITDPTPVGLAFLSNSGACTTPFPCNIGTLTSGQSGSITSTYTVPAGYTGVSISNTASISATENDPNTGDNSSTANTTVAQPADVSISKTGPTSASPGSNVTYTITVVNSGPSSAGSVVVSDPTPAGLTFVSNTGACTSAFPCSLGTMTAGQIATINATFSIPANFAGTFTTNTATVSSGATDPNSGNNTASATTSLAPQADVSVVKSGPASTTTGQNIVYTTTVTNNGPLAASNVFVTDNTPAGLTFVSNSGACTGTFPCALGTLNSGQSVTITSTYNVPSNYSGASITNTAGVSSSTFDGNTANNSSTANTTVVAPTPNADLRITKTGPAQASSASFITFHIAVTNLGPSSATNVVITDSTPSGLVFDSTSSPCAGFPCTIASMAPGATVTVDATYAIPSQTHGTVINTAHVSSSTTDPVATNNASSATVIVTPHVNCPGGTAQLIAPAANATVTSPVAFSWGTVAGATSYVLNITGGGNPPQSVTTNNTSTTVNLANGTYSWSVTAVGPIGCLPSNSNAQAFTVCNTLGAPTPSIVGESTTGQTYTVQWTSVAEAVGYDVEESGDSAFTSVTSFTVNGTSKQFTKNALTATPFFYRVRAMSACAQPGGYSKPVSVVVIPLPNPSDPNININVPNGSTTPVTFQVLIPGLPGGTTSFIATVDKPWLSVLPSSGLVPPSGVLVTIQADPSSLTNGTWTGTLIVVYGNAVVSGRAQTQSTTATAIPLSISLVTPVTPTSLTAPASSALIIPSVGHIAGTSTSSWRSDIRVANVSSAAQNYLLTFNPGSGDTTAVKTTSITVTPGGTTALDDIVRNWFGVGSLG
ncbi:MAG TPA: hypothetical protein VGJ82_23370, partial [Thermoanaerobaculia bacterium]